ncbi:glutamine synthetase [Pycnococcus provasolii]
MGAAPSTGTVNVNVKSMPPSSGGGINKVSPSPVDSHSMASPLFTTEGYGENVFKGNIAAKYLKKQGLTVDDLNDSSWVKNPKKADQIAAAVLDWAVERGASNYCHLFQPMAATYRPGQTSCVQLAMFEFDPDTGAVEWNFKGKHILQGETDGSSYPNGGLRVTHSAGGYLTIDPESPMFLRGDCVYIPACFVAFTGYALDEKTPLIRAVHAMSENGKRMFKALGYDIKGLVNNIGLEQELFFVPREHFAKRPDLKYTGRTVLGALPARGQEMSDHYMAPINLTGRAMACMQEIQSECYKLGIPLKTRHREVAPNQYEFAPLFGTVTTQTDQNLSVMQIAEEVAERHKLAALFIEKPFAGVNGSGKHNNWSIATTDGVNLYNPGQLESHFNDGKLTPIIMAATVAAIDRYGDLMRMAIAAPGNDFRLGAMEAPPAVMSTYLGTQMTEYLEKFVAGENATYHPTTTTVDLGAPSLPNIIAPAEDRNRTSPFPYGGHRFEFRAVGSSQNVSLVNTCLAAMMGKMFGEIATAVEGGASPIDVARDLLKKHMKCVYNGNGYDPEWPQKAVEKGVWRIDSGVEAIERLTDEKNVELFSSLNIFTAEECQARKDIMLELYVSVVEMECQVMIDMINQHCKPSCSRGGLPTGELDSAVSTLEAGWRAIADTSELAAKAHACRTFRLETMVTVRATVDALEKKCPRDCWTLPTYDDLLFLDTMDTPFSMWTNREA